MRLELTRKTDYAVRAMLVLARSRGQTLTGAAISAKTGIPARFVTQVMGHLVRAGLVNGVIGRSGGYRLDGDPAAISVLTIVEAVEGDTRRRHCVLRGGQCGGASVCEIHHVFSDAQDAFTDALSAWTLATVVAEGDANRYSRGASRGTPRPVRGAAG